MHRNIGRNCFACFLWILCQLPVPALAYTPERISSPTDATEPDNPKTTDFDPATMFTGDWGGLREKLHNRGLDLGAMEISEIFDSPTGGIKRGTTYQGRFEVNAALNFEKLLNIKGLTAFANAYQLHGHGMSTSNLSNIMTASNIEAMPSTRLNDLWLQQNLLDDIMSIRIGQLSADDEFTTSQYAGLFISSAFGWPSLLGSDLPSGGPAFPLATPGARIRVGKDSPWIFQTAVFDGNPSGDGGAPNPQRRDSSGTTFNLKDGALFMNELTYTPASSTDSVVPSGSYKVGLWYHTGEFTDQRYDNSGLSLANPASTGFPAARRGNYGVYGVIDQPLWIAPETQDRGVFAFGRIMWAPADRNVASYQIDAGLNMKGLIRGREDDSFGLGFSTLRISAAASNLDRDMNSYQASRIPVRDYESDIEATYQANLTPYLYLQPDVQYVMHPGGNTADPTSSGGQSPIKNAAIAGLRASVRF